MVSCELCGNKEAEYNALVEGASVKVCIKCSNFGKIIGKAKTETAPNYLKQKKQEKEQEMLIPDFKSIIRKKRESMNLSQKEFALKINEKESVVHKMETGEFSPSIDSAKNLEKILNVKLTEIYTQESNNSKNESPSSLTIGDLIKIKQRK